MPDDEYYVTLQAHVIAKAWQDPGFRRRLVQDPVEVLRESGIVVPEGIRIQVHENTDETVHLVIPARPDVGLELTASGFESVVDAVLKAGVWAIWCRRRLTDETENEQNL